MGDNSPGPGVTPSMVVIGVPSACAREHQAGAHRDAVEQHGAGAADAVLAAGMGAGEIELVAQAIEQRGARLDLDRVHLAVDVEFNAHGLCSPAHGHGVGDGAHGELHRDAAAVVGRGVQIDERVDIGERGAQRRP